MFSGLQAWAFKNSSATSVSYRQEALTVHKPLQLVYRHGITAVRVPCGLGYRCESPIDYISWRQGYHHKLYMHHGGFVIGVSLPECCVTGMSFPTLIPDECWFTGNDLRQYQECWVNACFSRLIHMWISSAWIWKLFSVSCPLACNSHCESCLVRRTILCSSALKDVH